MSTTAQVRFVAGTFLASAVLLWLGWMLLPVKIGAYFEPSLFGRVHEQFHVWIWLYRFHIFGMVIGVMAVIALAGLLHESSSRVVIWPGAAVTAAGLVVSALGTAFYYHHGAWGALETVGYSPQELELFVASLKVDTEYVTCLVRFGRVFTGLGLLVMVIGLWIGSALPKWLLGVGGIIGLTLMALTMLLPDAWDLYPPVFHAMSFWILAMGVVLWIKGQTVLTSSPPAGR